MGQKKDTPSEVAGIYIFYNTLYKEQPDSEMAEKWLMEHGCFDDEKQAELFEKYGKKSPTRRSPTKSPIKTTRTKKRKLDSEDEDHKPRKKKRKTKDKDRKTKRRKKDKKEKKEKRKKSKRSSSTSKKRKKKRDYDSSDCAGDSDWVP